MITRFLAELYRHGRFLELNLSIYFSPNTQLLGEAVALHALGVLFPGWERAAHWAETGGRIVQEQLQRQVRPDGSHFEQSAYYHMYALDFIIQASPASSRKPIRPRPEGPFQHATWDASGG